MKKHNNNIKKKSKKVHGKNNSKNNSVDSGATSQSVGLQLLNSQLGDVKIDLDFISNIKKIITYAQNIKISSQLIMGKSLVNNIENDIQKYNNKIVAFDNIEDEKDDYKDDVIKFSKQYNMEPLAYLVEKKPKKKNQKMNNSKQKMNKIEKYVNQIDADYHEIDKCSQQIMPVLNKIEVALIHPNVETKMPQNFEQKEPEPIKKVEQAEIGIQTDNDPMFNIQEIVKENKEKISNIVQGGGGNWNSIDTFTNCFDRKFIASILNSISFNLFSLSVVLFE